MDNSDIEKRLQELEELRNKVDHLLELSQLGESVRDELKEVKELRNKGINIPHLEKKFENDLDPKQSIKKTRAAPPLRPEIQEALDRTTSALKAARILGISYATFKKYARQYNIHKTKGWPIKKGEFKRGPTDPRKGKYPIDDILACKYPNFPIHRLKDKLIRSGIKKAECEQCGYKERRITDGKVPLLLNFEDGNNKNHTLENMRLLCYNCTFTSGKGYISKGPKTFDPDLLQDGKKMLKARF